MGQGFLRYGLDSNCMAMEESDSDGFGDESSVLNDIAPSKGDQTTQGSKQSVEFERPLTGSELAWTKQWRDS